MQNTLLLVMAILGLVIAVVNALIRKFRWHQDPELAAFVEILLSCIAISVAFKVAKLAIQLPSHEASDEDKIYFCLGSLALCWVSIATILRKFKPQ